MQLNKNPNHVRDTIHRDDDSHWRAPEAKVLHQRFGTLHFVFSLYPHQLPHVLGYLDASTHVGLRRLQAAWKGTSSAFRAREELYKCEISGEALWRSVGKSSLLGYTLYSNGTEDALEPLKC